ncbi:MAG TPA: lactate utilization protein [Rhizobiaceae bacterium]|nr:lactate utilization protein [Rhizobiaceae bacterium]
MSARDAILAKVRASLDAHVNAEARAQAVADRLKRAPKGVIPVRGKLPPEERVALFCTKLEGLAATVDRVKDYDAVPRAVAAYLRERNLPATFRMGLDKRLTTIPWDKQRSLQVKSGPSDGDDEVGVSHANSAVAETGTLVMVSGDANPTTINFLPEHHIVIVDAAQVDGDLEAAISRVRKKYGKGEMPRTVNFISGPSRSGDIEQKIILGAHGPRALHVVVVG